MFTLKCILLYDKIKSQQNSKMPCCTDFSSVNTKYSLLDTLLNVNWCDVVTDGIFTFYLNESEQMYTHRITALHACKSVTNCILYTIIITRMQIRYGRVKWFLVRMWAVLCLYFFFFFFIQTLSLPMVSIFCYYYIYTILSSCMCKCAHCAFI